MSPTDPHRSARLMMLMAQRARLSRQAEIAALAQVRAEQRSTQSLATRLQDLSTVTRAQTGGALGAQALRAAHGTGLDLARESRVIEDRLSRIDARAADLSQRLRQHDHRIERLEESAAGLRRLARQTQDDAEIEALAGLSSRGGR